MKKIAFLVVVMISLFSCEKDVLADYELITSNDTLVFNNSEIKSFFISTKPKSDCDYKITSYPSWVTVNRDYGVIDSKNSIQEIQITSNLKGFKPGVYEGRLQITSTLGNKSIFLRGFIGENTMFTIPDSLHFAATNNTLKFAIKNQGNVVLSYSASSPSTKVTVTPSTGSVVIDGQSELTVNLNRDGLSNGKSYSKLFFNINNKKDSLVVVVDNYKEQKIKLNSDVVDAEYSKVRDELVFVSANPSSINIIKSGSQSIVSIPLVYTPTCVSISKEGDKAVVGHDGHITYVNLSAKTVIKTYSVSCEAIDVVLTNNKWAYVFPKENQWEYIRGVNLSLNSDNESNGSGTQIYAGTKARLHPLGKYIYGANNGLSPSDIEKFDFESGFAIKLYDSPYHGDYPMNGNLWFSEDGSRIFTRGKTVLKTSETKSQDMVYNGKINTDSSFINMEWLDHSDEKNNLYTILSSGYSWSANRSPYIYIYNSTNLSFKNKLDLEKFLVPSTNGGTYYDAIPYFVFSNATGNSIMVVTKALNSGLEKEWAIQYITIQ